MARVPASSSSRSLAGVSSRRTFLSVAALSAGAVAGIGTTAPAGSALAATGVGQPKPFKISLAQWSLHKELGASRLDPLDFPRAANKFGIDAVEYVSSFYRSRLGDRAHFSELKRRAAGEGVSSLLIMVDGEGQLGDPDAKQRQRAVDNHKRWVEAAAYLGCHAVRVNAESRGSEEEQVQWVSDGLRRLCRFSDDLGIDVLIENHGGLSANAGWVVEVINAVGHRRCGSLPDFGNFDLGGGKRCDAYQGVRELMPFARAVSAKAHDFDARGEETRIDYLQMLGIVTSSGYRGYVGIEYEGTRLSEPAGIVRTKELLERVQRQIATRATQR